MGKISIDLNSFKAAGIYTLEVDNTARLVDNSTDSLRMLVGFSNKGPFNRPVLLQEDSDRLNVFGDIDQKLEHKGCFFNRMLRTLLTGGPVIALNLLKVDENYSGNDLINIATMSMNAGEANPKVADTERYGQYDYLSDSIDRIVYGTSKGDNIPFVGSTPYASVFNRSRFWIPDKELLTAEAARNLSVPENVASYSFESGNLLNFANVGTEEFSLLVFKPASMPGFEVTAETWFGGKENIPYGWIRPYDYISDYFLQVVCVKGNWTNYSVLSTDPVWKGYFDKKGIKKDRINQFMAAEGITILGSWSGSIIPDFTDKQGNMISLEKKVNAATERTGLLMSFNQDAANVLAYDYSGANSPASDPDTGCWGLDTDGSGDIEGGEGVANFIVDMVGHEVFKPKPVVPEVWNPVEYDSSIADDEYLYNEIKNKFYRFAVDVNQLTAEDIDASVAVYNSNEKDPSTGKPAGELVAYIKPGKFIPREMIKAAQEGTPATANNIKDLIESKYYIVSKTGTLTSSNIVYEFTLTTDSSAIDPSTSVAVVNVDAEFNFDGETYRQQYVVELGENNTIASARKLGEVEHLENNEEALKPSYGINFLSYDYVESADDHVRETIEHVEYFSNPTIWDGEMPVSVEDKNMFIITDASQWVDSKIKLGDYVKNITYNNEPGETEEYQLIPGLTKVIRKQFLPWVDGALIYKNTPYKYLGEVGEMGEGSSRKAGVYLITCTSPVLIEEGTIVRQLPISDNKISGSLRFIPLKGLSVTSKHRPGYDEEGQLNIEKGIEKIYGMLKDEGIRRGLMNPAMVDYRYIIDSMSYGLGAELGGKVELSKVAKERGKCLAILNLPSAKQFAVCSNPYFCNTYTPGASARPSLNTKYIPEGGNTEMGSTVIFSLPSEENGAKFTACFWPNLIYQEAGKTISVPPSADVANVLNRKFNGMSDSYGICANTNGILSNKYLKDLEFLADIEDRKVLEPFGVNTIIKDQGSIMIYGNQTAYQAMKSDFNKLHIRENLNTAEIECEKVLKRYNFKYNTAAVRANIVQQLSPILQAMQIAGALVRYEIICDESNNTPEVIEADTCVVEVNLWMNHGMEKIIQKFTLQRLADQ